MHVVVVRTTVRQAMNEPRISVEIENNGLINSKERIEISIRQSVRMFRARLKPEKINDVDVTNLEIGKLLAQQHNGCQSFLCRYVARRGHHHKIGRASC